MMLYKITTLDAWIPDTTIGGVGACYLRRNAAIKNSTPPWADKCAIRHIYKEAKRISVETGVKHEVDHIIPLQGKLVSGLHVHENLQIITMTENRIKRNKTLA